MSAAQTEAIISDLRAQQAAQAERLSAIDTAISEAQALLNEAEARLREQEGEVARTQLATGRRVAISTGQPARAVQWTDGRGTVTYGGQPAADSARGKAEAALAAYLAMEQDIQPIRGAVASLERERGALARDVGLVAREIEAHERHLESQRAAEAERVALVGGNDWQGRLRGILGRLRGQAA